MIREITNTPTGLTWTQWGDSGRPLECDVFCGSPYGIFFRDYWVYRCTKTLAGGKLEFFTYFVGAGREPTLERVRWSFGQALKLDHESVLSLYAALTDSLTRACVSPSKSKNLDAYNDKWAQSWEFSCRAGVVSTLPSGESGFVIERSSHALGGIEIDDPMFDTSHESAEDVRALRREVGEALQPGWPALGRAVEASPPSLDAAPDVAAALRAVRGKSGEEHDLLLFWRRISG